MSKELFQDYINGLSISELSNKYKVSKTRVYKDIAEYSKEQGKILKILFEKRIDMWHLVDLLDQTYEMYVAFCKSEKYKEDYILTKEEFDLLKEVIL